MRKLYLVGILGVLVGYAANDLVGLSGIGFFGKAEAQSGIDWRSLSRDREFRRAVLSVVDGNCYVESEYIYC